MRIISYNVNGIRAAIKKGLIDWLATDPADVVCLQETKATEADIDIKALEALGYSHHWFSAQKKGYSGVAVFSKIKPTNVSTGTGHEMSDAEGYTAVVWGCDAHQRVLPFWHIGRRTPNVQVPMVKRNRKLSRRTKKEAS